MPEEPHRRGDHPGREIDREVAPEPAFPEGRSRREIAAWPATEDPPETRKGRPVRGDDRARSADRQKRRKEERGQRKADPEERAPRAPSTTGWWRGLRCRPEASARSRRWRDAQGPSRKRSPSRERKGRQQRLGEDTPSPAAEYPPIISGCEGRSAPERALPSAPKDMPMIAKGGTHAKGKASRLPGSGRQAREPQRDPRELPGGQEAPLRREGATSRQLVSMPPSPPAAGARSSARFEC